MTDIAIIIPAYEPDDKLISLIETLKKQEISRPIFVVDDGSGSEYANVFDAISDKVTLYTHHVNMGKGRALKDAMNIALNMYPDMIGCVTMDSDGQHSVGDMEACIKALQENPASLIFGVRDFDKANVPLKSSFGNKITRRTMKLFAGIDVTDTQTGLRAIPREYMKFLLCEKGERYEFEMNMLLSAKEREISIVEVPIETIYLNENKGSHFNPLKDSVRIYAVFLKFMAGSLSSSVLDLTLFQILCNILNDKNLGSISYIVLATYMARALSSVYNFAFNYRSVFKAKGNVIGALIRYFMLAVAIMLVSGFAVDSLHAIWPITELAIKIPVDVLLFLVSFWVQKEFIYNNKSKRNIDAKE